MLLCILLIFCNLGFKDKRHKNVKITHCSSLYLGRQRCGGPINLVESSPLCD